MLPGRPQAATGKGQSAADRDVNGGFGQGVQAGCADQVPKGHHDQNEGPVAEGKKAAQAGASWIATDVGDDFFRHAVENIAALEDAQPKTNDHHQENWRYGYLTRKINTLAGQHNTNGTPEQGCSQQSGAGQDAWGDAVNKGWRHECSLNDRVDR